MIYPSGLSKSDREKLGMVFTDDKISDFMVRRSLNLLNAAFKSKNKSIKDARILDPCIGGASFDIALFKVLEEYIEDFKIGNFLQNNFVGIDIEKSAIELAKKNLKEVNASYVGDLNLQCKDFLIDFDKRGFDLIIGNPPYIGEKGNKDVFTKIRDTEFGKKYYEKGMDYFYFFIEKSLEILNEDGILAMITPAYWTRADSASKLRETIRNVASFVDVVDFGDFRVFKDAVGHHSLIFFLQKKKRTEFNHYLIKEKKKNIGKILSGILNDMSSDFFIDKYGTFVFNSKHFTDKDKKSESCIDGYENSIFKMDNSISKSEISIFKPEETVINKGCFLLKDKDSSYIKSCVSGDFCMNYSPYFNFISRETQGIFEKIKKCTKTTLREIASINQGIVSGADKVTNRNLNILKEHMSGEMIADINIGDGIFVLNEEEASKYLDKCSCLVGFYKNSDITAYSIKKPKYYLFYSTDKMNKEDEKIVINHLCKFEAILSRRRETLLGKLAYYHLQWARRQEIFTGEKIVSPQRALRPSFAYSNSELYASADVYYITDIKENTFFVLGYLNSSFADFYLRNMGKKKGRYLELYQRPLSEIPIICIAENKKNQIAYRAKKITEKNLTSEEMNKLKSEIDSIIWSELKV